LERANDKVLEKEKAQREDRNILNGNLSAQTGGCRGERDKNLNRITEGLGDSFKPGSRKKKTS